MRAFLTIFVVSILFTIARGFQVPAWYKCDPLTCIPPDCRCPSSQSPLPIEETPQIVLVTNDDEVDANVSGWMTKMLGSFSQVNGACPLPVTWFALSRTSDCASVKERFAIGDEISTHTVNHTELARNLTTAEVEAEILGGRDYLIQGCEIPASKVRGFRSPFLVANPRHREIMKKHHFLYDSSEIFNSATFGDRVWPFTLDNGMPDAGCTPEGTFQACTSEEKYPGMWEIPVWPLLYDGQAYAMDVGAASPGNGESRPVDEVLIANFDATYNGNRAPLPLYIHSFWFDDTRVVQMQNFMMYAASKPDVYFLTMQQLIEWMRYPVPASNMGAWLEQRCGGREPAAKSLSWLTDELRLRPAIMGRRLLRT